MSRSTVARTLAALGAALFIAATPTVAFAHGSDDPYTTETVETGVNTESSTSMLPVVIGGGAAAVVAIAGGVFIYTRRNK